MSIIVFNFNASRTRIGILWRADIRLYVAIITHPSRRNKMIPHIVLVEPKPQYLLWIEDEHGFLHVEFTDSE